MIANKINLKRYLIIVIIIFFIFAVLSIILNIIQYNKYTKNANVIINQIIVNIEEKFPDMDINEIVELLNKDNLDSSDILIEYGIDLKKDSIIMNNDIDYPVFLALNTGLILFLLFGIIITFILYNKSQNNKINEITKYIQEINNGNYTLSIQDNNEDELSILKNELYKITIMLKEQAENSKNDKLSLKKSIEDISHQLKTPLTSITIMLDNILDNPNMKLETRKEFTKDIYREIANMNFFVQALLKLSKFDADTILFNDKIENLIDIIKEAEKNVSTICDLKNVKIILEKSNLDENMDKIQKPKLYCDFKWQVEALTNILKNSIEHSYENTNIYISFSENNMYSEIVIKDEGSGIDKQDLKHIFERFYKGKNSNKNGIGIGLALAKTIVEKDNGYITVESEINKGTKFSMRYLK